MASEKIVKGGGGENRNLKNPGIDFYSGFRKNGQGGVQIENPKNPGNILL